MNIRNRKGAAAERFAERRRREDAAPRLKERVPDLASLRLEVEELHDTAGTGNAKHVRLIVVDHAPALFEIPCGDTSCEGGGYDVTSSILHALQNHEAQFVADDRCHGTTGNAPCRRALHITGAATYTPAP